MPFCTPEIIPGSQLFELLSGQPALRKTAPALAAFFKELLSREKAVQFNGGYVISSLLPPVPGAAWDRFAERLRPGADASARLFSVTWAVTNRCTYGCWHCYNAGRSQQDLPLATLAPVARRLVEMGAVRVHLTGGDPLLRDDLEEIAALFGPAAAVSVGTTGLGLTPERAARLRASGVFAAGISLDSHDPAEHDRMRGRPGAHAIALEGIAAARGAGMYAYVVAVASDALLCGDRLAGFLEYARDAGALEVHLLEPCPVGRLYGHDEVRLSAEARCSLLDWHGRAARDLSLPLLSSFAYIESPETFGCGAGGNQLYLDGSGEVSPCQWVPLSFGNLAEDTLETILRRIEPFFGEPRTECVGMELRGHLPDTDSWPLSPEVSLGVCKGWLDAEHPVPAFHQLLRASRDAVVSAGHLAEAYDEVHGAYDRQWLSQAARPIHDLLERLPLQPGDRVFEAGCGTGYATAMLAERVGLAGRVTAVDLSAGMLSEARKRIVPGAADRVTFLQGDALELLRTERGLDWVVTTWVLGYIPLDPFFAGARQALRPGGGLAFVVHRDGSPAEATDLFARLAAGNPDAMERAVAFDFPRDADDARERIEKAGFAVETCHAGTIMFPCASAAAALEHLLESGAGTAYRDAVRPDAREALMRRFVEMLGEMHAGGEVPVTHDYILCVARA